MMTLHDEARRPSRPALLAIAPAIAPTRTASPAWRRASKGA
jgi:hypothetical protein